MLVLSRKKGESIVIDGGIEVTVVSVDGDNIRLGIEAPKHISIHRKEIFLAIQQENESARASVFNLDEFKDLKK